MACLIVASGKNAGAQYRLPRRPVTAGRDPARDIQLVDPKVSRKHFQIRCDGKDYTLVELHSRNGVRVNGRKVQSKQLADGDEIRAGDTVLMFFAEDIRSNTDALTKRRLFARDLRENMTQMQRD
jgi:pSer/pThr/pTyr-binding forkhead associated (FHA) protein